MSGDRRGFGVGLGGKQDNQVVETMLLEVAKDEEFRSEGRKPGKCKAESSRESRTVAWTKRSKDPEAFRSRASMDWGSGLVVSSETVRPEAQAVNVNSLYLFTTTARPRTCQRRSGAAETSMSIFKLPLSDSSAIGKVESVGRYNSRFRHVSTAGYFKPPGVLGIARFLYVYHLDDRTYSQLRQVHPPVPIRSLAHYSRGAPFPLAAS